MESFLEELVHAQSVVDVNIAAGSAHQRLERARRRTKIRQLALVAVILVMFLAFSMALHPGVQLDHVAAKMF